MARWDNDRVLSSKLTGFGRLISAASGEADPWVSWPVCHGEQTEIVEIALTPSTDPGIAAIFAALDALDAVATDHESRITTLEGP